MTDDENTPLEWWTTAHDARVKARRAFFRGLLIGGAVIWIADAALSETIQIGRTYINGESYGTTTVTIEPSDVPGQLAIVTLQNEHVNQGTDDGDYSLTFEGMVFGIIFTWDADPLLGSDRITVIPPAGITCAPADCGVTVQEGQAGSVILFDYVGF
jgi:hypothetical protein